MLATENKKKECLKDCRDNSLVVKLPTNEELYTPIMPAGIPGRALVTSISVTKVEHKSKVVAICEGCRHSIVPHGDPAEIVYTVKGTGRYFLFHNETCVV